MECTKSLLIVRSSGYKSIASNSLSESSEPYTQMGCPAASRAVPGPLLLASGPVHGVFEPSLCVIAQGSNEILLDAVVRLTRVLDAPDDLPILRPLLTQEIIYRFLMGEQGNRLRHLAILGGYTTHIARAVVQLRKNFDQPCLFLAQRELCP